MKTAFDRYNLDARVLDCIPALGFKKPTEVQHRVIPLLMQGKNLLVEAPTGSGKTAAFGFPLISQIDLNKRAVQVLILVPSRELAKQVEAALKSFSNQSLLKIEAVYGGAPIKDSMQKLARNPHILVAVPGRLRDLMRDEKFPYFWRNVNHLVLDEADRLLEQGFQEEVAGFLPLLKKKIQVALFSATITEDIEQFAKEQFYRLIPIRLWQGEAWKRIQFWQVKVNKGKSEAALLSLIQQENIQDALIFCNKREEVYSVSRFLRAGGIRCEAYHGLMDQVERDAIMNRFRLKQVQFLVATDLAARGLDIENLSAVIHFSFPDDLEVYLHRVGRTGRAGKKGECYSLVTSEKESILHKSFHKQTGIPFKDIELKETEIQNQNAAEGEKIEKVSVNRGKTDKLRKGDIVGFLVQDAGMPAEEIGTIAIYDRHTLVDLPKRLAGRLLKNDADFRIKGKSVKITKYRLEEEKARAGKVKRLVVSSKVREAKKRRKQV